MFYLVGSRFFGDNRLDSDWDYIGRDTPENREHLEKRGFRRLDSVHVRYFKHGIDVHLVSNLEAQLYARDNAKGLHKDERRLRIPELINAYELGRIT